MNPMPAMPNHQSRSRTILSGFRGLPQVLRLVYSTHRGLTLGLGVVTLLTGLAPAANIWVTSQIIDAILSALATVPGGVQRVMGLIAIQLGLSIVSSLLEMGGNLARQLLAELVSTRIRLMVMKKATELDLAFFEQPAFYDRLRQVHEEAAFRPTTMIAQIFDLIRTALTFSTMIALLIQLDWWIAGLALLLPIPSFIVRNRYGLLGYLQSLHLSPNRRKMSYYETLVTTDTYAKEVKLFSLGDFFVERFRGLAVACFAEQKKLLVRRQLYDVAWSSASLVANAGLYAYVAWQAVSGAITLGGLTLYTQAVLQVSGSFQGILYGVSNLYEHQLFVAGFFEFLEFTPTIAAPAAPRGLTDNDIASEHGFKIEFRDVCFSYPGSRAPALNGVSFTIEAGESIALVGQNGAGKSTIIKLLSRLYDPESGTILINGYDVKEYDPEQLRAHIGMMFQDYATYALSATTNIGVGNIADINNQRLIERAAQQGGAAELINGLPAGYETLLGHQFDGGTQLSGGQWQKIALARAIMRDSRILVLDEPSSALDAQAEHELFSQFRELMHNRTVLFISHRFSTVRLADRIFVIEDGRLVESGSHPLLMQAGGRYAELFTLQATAYQEPLISVFA